MKKWIALMVVSAILFIATAAWWYIQSTSQPISGSPTQDTSSSDTPSDSTGTESKDGKAPITSDAEDPEKIVEPAPQSRPPQITEAPVAGEPGVASKEEAQKVVSEQKESLGLDEESELTVVSGTDDGRGNQYYQVKQTYKGLPIYGAKSVLEVENGKAKVLTGGWVTELDLDINPTYPAKEALRKALDGRGVPADREIEINGGADLIIFFTEQGAHLCWNMVAHLTNPVSAPQKLLVDAHEPQVLVEQAAIKP